MKTVNHELFKRKCKLLHTYGVNRTGLYRWVVDLAIVRLVTAGRVTPEQLNKEGIDFDETLNNAKIRDYEAY